ncbi:MAG: alpha/beta fold hydrolase [Pirellulales bacterium]
MLFTRRLARWLVLVLIAYLLVVLMFTLFQRSLIYFPAQTPRLLARTSGLGTARVEDVTVVADDGIELHGWHFRPSAAKTASAEPDPAVGSLAGAPRVAIYFSGNAGHRGYRIEEAQLLNRLGCHVLLFDYRGYGDNAGSPTEEALAGDARSVWRYVTQQQQVAPGRVILVGESLGGGVAVRLASECCEQGTPPGGLVLRATFSSLVDVASWHYPWLPVAWALEERYPSIERAPRITCPILQFHGTRDTIVPESLGRRLFAAFPEMSSSGQTKRYIELPGVDHNDILERAEDEIEGALRDWLAQLD